VHDAPCGACGDGCRDRGECQLNKDSPVSESVQQKPVAITKEMVFAFHRSLTDSDLGESDFQEIEKGLKAAFACIDQKPDHADTLTDAARDVLAERQRQISKEGWTPEHDDAHVNEELAALACFYSMPPGARDWPASETGYGATFGSAILPDEWSTKTGDRRRELVKSGALVLERLDRVSQEGEV